VVCASKTSVAVNGQENQEKTTSVPQSLRLPLPSQAQGAKGVEWFQGMGPRPSPWLTAQPPQGSDLCFSRFRGAHVRLLPCGVHCRNVEPTTWGHGGFHQHFTAKMVTPLGWSTQEVFCRMSSGVTGVDPQLGPKEGQATDITQCQLGTA
jgi:hypothetical protein